MKFRFLEYLLPVALLGLTACSNNSSSTVASSAGVLYVTSQGNRTVSGYTVNLGSGGLSLIGSSPSGAVPSAIAITPTVDALFVADSGSNTIHSYTINSDGSLATVSGTTATGLTPTGLAIDPAGKFLFVANQGWSNIASQGPSSISVFAISGTGLKAVPGSPFTTIPAGYSYPNGTLPSAVAVSASGNFLYVANELANFVSVFKVNSTSGALTALGVPFYATGSGPAGLAITPSGAFLYVANSDPDSDDISAFAICDSVVTTCADVNSPDGTLTPVPGSPFPAGLGPVAIAVDPGFNFVYVVNKESNQVSQYSYGGGTGVLTPLSLAAISTGATPVSIAIRSGAVGVNVGNATNNPTDYVYVANMGAGTVSIFSLTTATGLMQVIGTPFTVFAQPSAVGAK